MTQSSNNLQQWGPYEGVVTDNRDPDKLGRVKIRVPGLLDEPDSDWCFQMGAPGGGVAQRGHFDVPAVDSEVYVWFLGGDVDKPRWVTGHWGIRDGQSELPTQARDALEENPNDADAIKVYETNTYVMVFDERDGQERFFIKRKREIEGEPDFDDEALDGNALMFEMDATNGTIALSAPGGVSIQTLGLVNINGNIVQVANRKVTNGIGDAI